MSNSCADDPSPEELSQLGSATTGVCCAVLVLGCVGFACNCVAIPVLLFGRDLSGAFYKILAFLAIFDNTFLFWSISEAARKVSPRSSAPRWYLLLFAHLGFQLRAMAFLSSALMTVALSLERFLAVTRWVKGQRHSN